MSDSEQKATSSNQVIVKEPDSSENVLSKPNNIDNGDKNIDFQKKNGPHVSNNAGNDVSSSVRPPKRPLSETVIEILDSDSDGSSVCAVDSYRVTADVAKRMREARDDYSSFSSDSFSSDEEDNVSFKDDSSVLTFKKIYSNIIEAKLNKRAEREAKPKLNPLFSSQEVSSQLKKHWNESIELKNESIDLIIDPFRLCRIENFLENSDYVNNIIDDMNTLDWSRKKNDLYEFHQTNDLADKYMVTWQRSICEVYELLKNNVMPWVSEITNTRLTSLSASCSLYGPGDHLLVHDDMLSDRRIAFILYYTPWNIEGSEEEKKNGWSENMGGALELFARDERGRPTVPKKQILPKNNSMAFFKVGPETFHQVSEVTSFEYPRLSINGWFHGPADDEAGSKESEQDGEQEDDVETFKPHSEIILMNEWLDSTYQLPRTRIQIQRQMEEASEISLENLLVDDKFAELANALRTTDLWEPSGPANQHKYEVISPEKLASLSDDSILKQWSRLVTSTMFFNFLISCTELKLTTYCDLEIQRWTAGCYTMLPPKSRYSICELDATMYVDLAVFGGGVTSYIVPEDTSTEPLVTLAPTSNALNLVYSDEGTARFTKYVSKLSAASGRHFYMLRISYRE